MRVVFAMLIIISALRTCNDGHGDCVEETIDRLGMKTYRGEVKGCEDYLELLIVDGERIFNIGNHCKDVVPRPFDCTGKLICERPDDQLCLSFQRNSVSKGIIAVAQ
jgi:hypothetical protein